MKKIVATICAAAIAATAFITPVKADNSEEVIIGVLGGALGGLILGEVLARPRYAPAPIYVEPEYVTRECWYKKVRRYDPYTDTYVVVRKKVCNY